MSNISFLAGPIKPFPVVDGGSEKLCSEIPVLVRKPRPAIPLRCPADPVDVGSDGPIDGDDEEAAPF